MASSLRDEHQHYKSSQETFDSSHEIFRAVFPDGFAWEVLAVYSGPPVVTFKFRHWGVMKGSFKGHEPTGEVAESFGVCVATVLNSALWQLYYAFLTLSLPLSLTVLNIRFSDRFDYIWSIVYLFPHIVHCLLYTSLVKEPPSRT
jgi:hypothetical protein